MRTDEYTSGVFQFSASAKSYDYEQLDYEKLREIYLGHESTGMQYGALLAQLIVDTMTSFELGELPQARVKNYKDGKEDEELTRFANQFLRDQHPALLAAVHTKNLYGDGFVAFNPDRNIEAIPPEFVDPGWTPFNNDFDNATVIQNRVIKEQGGTKKAKVKITRQYDKENVEYTIEVEGTGSFEVPKGKKIANPMGVCPVLLLSNNPRAGQVFGMSDFYSCIPYFLLYHRVISKGYESQQYHGKPLFVVTGIEGNVKKWMADTFEVDADQTSSTSVQEAILSMFKKHKMLFLSGNVQAGFLESKSPTGRTSEILDIIFTQISRLSGVPEFLFGGEITGSDASVREQFVNLKAKINLKRRQLEPVLRKLIKMAFVVYTTVSNDEETGEPLDTYSLVNTWEDTKEFVIDLIWPELLGSDQRTKLEAVAMLAQAGAISRESMIGNFQQFTANPDEELIRIEEEVTRFAEQVDNPSVETQGAKNATERRNKDKSTTNDNDDGQKSGRSTADENSR